MIRQTKRLVYGEFIMTRILVTGGAGYIGSVLIPKLLLDGFKVTCVDNLLYEPTSLMMATSNKNFDLVIGDARDEELMRPLIENADVIIPLACMTGAPLCNKDKVAASTVNRDSVIMCSKLSSKNQLLIYPCTNSGYGIGEEGIFCTEESPLNPISLYGKTKVDAEKIVLKHKNSIVFRLATVFGYSYRMRTDLLVNFLVNMAVRNKKISLFEPHFRRNYIHVLDVANAFIFSISNFNKMRGNIFNVGLSNANLTKIQLAQLIKKNIKGTKIINLKNKKDPDKRDYFVSNKKIERLGFKPNISIEEGIIELKNIFETFNFEKNKNNY